MTSAIDPSVIGAGNVDKASVRLQLERARDEITDLQDDKFDKTGGTLTGDLLVSKATPVVEVRKAAATQNARLAGSNGTTLRWTVDLGNTVAESGGNAGSNFAIARYSDTGVLIDTPLAITRSTGAPSFANAGLWRTALGGTTIGNALFTAADTASARAAIVAMAILTTGATVGQVTVLQSGSGALLAAPANDTWVCLWFGINGSGAVVSVFEVAEVAGGTTLKAGSAGVNYIGFAIRKA